MDKYIDTLLISIRLIILHYFTLQKCKYCNIMGSDRENILVKKGQIMEELRNKLYQLITEKGLLNEATILVSQELDKLILSNYELLDESPLISPSLNR